MPDVYDFLPGPGPLLVSSPHDGRLVPDELLDRFSAAGRALPDTDWHVNELYNFVGSLGLPMIRARYSRYVVDLNRPPDGSPLYPGATPTGVCPVLTFAGDPIYREARGPDDAEVAGRVERFWTPYHERLAQELAEMRRRHGFAILWDAHSIRSEVPRLFEGRLPDLNFGTADGRSCSPAMENALRECATHQQRYSFVFNGRFKGGYITRRHGRPAEGIHAVQLELSQRTYMDEERPERVNGEKLEGFRPFLRACIQLLTAASWNSMARGTAGAAEA